MRQVPVDLFQERALAAEVGQVTLPPVTGGLDADELDPQVLDAFDEQLADVFGLGHAMGEVREPMRIRRWGSTRPK
jgi:hypothetical protein